MTPAFNEAPNLPLLHARLHAALDPLGLAWEWIVVDDHSADDTFAVAAALAGQDARVRGVRLVRNAGSHAAILCGLASCTGDAIVVMASDLQDPPESIPALVARWRDGADIVWAARAARADTTLPRRLLARAYHDAVRRLGRLAAYPPTGADFLLLTRPARDRLLAAGDAPDIFVALARLGGQQVVIASDKQPRRHGRSGWTFRRQLRLALGGLWTAVRPQLQRRTARSWPIEATTDFKPSPREGGEKVPEGRMRGLTVLRQEPAPAEVAPPRSPSSGASRHLLPAFAGRRQDP